MGDLEKIIYDWDGTVVDTLQLIKESAIEAIAYYKENMPKVISKHLYIPTDKETEALRSKSAKEVIHVVFERRRSLWLLPFVLEKGWQIYNKKRDSIQPYNGIVEVINGLAQHYQIGILSSNKEETIKNVRNRLGLECPDKNIYHSQTFCGWPALFGKYNRLKKIIEEDGGKKPLLVFDEVRDLHTAERLDIPYIIVTWGLNNKEAFLNVGANPLYMIDKPSELPKKIEYIRDLQK